MRKYQILFFALFSLTSLTVTFGGSQAWAQKACDIVYTPASQFSPLERTLMERNIPAVRTTVSGGRKIPVILMNAKTGAQVQDILKNSVGTLVAHQPDYKNDHGLFRLGLNIIDLDAPGHRQRGELHRTGISWVDVNSYLDRGSSGKRLEVLYNLSPSEMKTAALYQLMRRAAILRVRFTFGDFGQDTKQLNFLKNGGENCFSFCAASYVSIQLQEINQRFQEKQLGTLAEVSERPDVKAWIAQAKTELLLVYENKPETLFAKIKSYFGFGVSTTNADLLNAELPLKAGIPESLKRNEIFAQMDSWGQQETLNWILAGAISNEYMTLTRELGFQNTGNGFNGIYNPRASALLIYDAQATVENFLSRDYSSPGVFSTWKNTNTEPLK